VVYDPGRQKFTWSVRVDFKLFNVRTPCLQAQDHKNKEKEANFQAASQIFKHNNSNRDRQEADLHGLHPQEAVLVVEQIILAKRRGGFYFEDNL